MKENAHAISSPVVTVVLALGGNEGNVLNNFEFAISKMHSFGKVVSKSSIYKTAAWGMENAPDFLNMVVVLESTLGAKDLLLKVLDVEKQLGRKRGQGGYQNRPLDIDILFYGASIINEKDLVVPHPEMENRRFVLEPLSEVMPDFKHPVLLKSISLLLNECRDTLKVEKL